MFAPLDFLRRVITGDDPSPPPTRHAPVPPAKSPPPEAPPTVRRPTRAKRKTPQGEPPPKPASEWRMVTLGQSEIPYELKRSERRRRVGLLVDDRGLIVMAPYRTTDHHIEKVLQDGSAWIRRKLAHWQASAPPARHWRSGALLDYLGDQLSLDIVEGGVRPTVMLLDEKRLQVRIADPLDEAAVRLALVQWYKRHAQAHLPARVEYFARQLNLRKLPRFFLSSAATRWGSCNAHREIRLNWRLMQAPTSVIDYVAAHEVAHVIEMNHSPRFWQVVERLCPGHAGPRAELDAMTRHYMNW